MACPNAVLRWSISHTGARPVVFASTRAYLFVAVRLSPLRDEARACREASAAALDSAERILRPPEALSEAEVIEAEAELKALQRHALELVDPEA
jgi:hypothetical protein